MSAVLALLLVISPSLLWAAQGGNPESTKETKEQERPSSGFEDNQSATCLSATQQVKLIASIVESYARRLGACVASNRGFQDDCSADFARLRQSYGQYQLALASVRNYCR